MCTWVCVRERERQIVVKGKQETGRSEKTSGKQRSEGKKAGWTFESKKSFFSSVCFFVRIKTG